MKYQIYDQDGILVAQCATLPGAHEDAETLARAKHSNTYTVVRADITKRLRKNVIRWDVQQAQVVKSLVPDIGSSIPELIGGWEGDNPATIAPSQ